MSGKLVGMVFDHYPFAGGEKLLAVKLADNAHDNGCSIFPSVATLSRQTHQSERTIQYQLKRMLARGWLVLVKHAHGGRGHAREYRIHPDFISAYDSRTLPEQRPTWEFKCVDKEGDKQALKGANIAPFTEPERVQSETLKGATAVAQKGATAVAPQPSLTVIQPNTPLPPDGGDAENFNIDKLLTSLIHAHGAHDTSDTKPVRRALAALRPDASMATRMLADLAAEVSTDKWQRDAGRWRPKLSRWLRGWHESIKAGVTPVPCPPSAAEKTREQIEKSKADTKPPPDEIREQLRQMSARFKGVGAAPFGKAVRTVLPKV